MNYFLVFSGLKSSRFVVLRASVFSGFLVLVSWSSVFAVGASLSWDANTEADLSGYNVYMGTVSGSYGSPISVGNTTAYTTSHLVDGTYFFAVTVVDISGNESGFSNEVSKTVVNSGAIPPPIGGGDSGLGTGVSGPAGGCGIIQREGQKLPGPQDSAGMLTLAAFIFLILLKRAIKSRSAHLSNQYEVRSGPHYLDSGLRSYFPRHQAICGSLMD